MHRIPRRAQRSDKAVLGRAHRFLNSFVNEGNQVPAESWVTVSGMLFADETQFCATKTSVDDILNSENMPECAFIQSQALSTLRFHKQLAPALGALPTWAGKTKTPRKPDREQEGTPGQDRDHTASYDSDAHVAVKALMKEFWKNNHDLRIAGIANAAGVNFRQFPDSFKDKCLNKVLGKCTRGNCIHSHDLSTIGDQDMQTFCTMLKPGVAKLEGGRKRRSR